MLQLILICLTIIIPLKPLASDKVAKSNFTGTSIGIEAGTIFSVVSSKSHIDTTNAIFNGDSSKYSYNKTGGIAGIICGYSIQTNNRFFIGAEASIQKLFSNNTGTDDAKLHETVSFKSKESYKAILQIGKIFNQCLININLGLKYTKHSINVNYSEPGVLYSYRKKKFTPGTLLGVRVTLPIEKNLSVGLDGSFCSYKKQEFNVPQKINGEQYNISTKMKPSDTSLTILLKYHFD